MARLQGIVERNRRNGWTGAVMTTDELALALEEEVKREALIESVRVEAWRGLMALLDHDVEEARSVLLRIRKATTEGGRSDGDPNVQAEGDF